LLSTDKGSHSECDRDRFAALCGYYCFNETATDGKYVSLIKLLRCFLGYLMADIRR